MYPSKKVRRLATLGEMLPESELDKFIAIMEKTVKELDRDGWRTQLNEAVELLLRQHGGDVRATLDALDRIVGNSSEKSSDPQLSLALSAAE